MTEVRRCSRYFHVLIEKLNERIENRPSESIVITTGPFSNALKRYRLVHRHNDGIETHYIRITDLDIHEARLLNMEYKIPHLYGETI